MALMTARATSKPKKRKGRAAATARPFQNSAYNSSTADSITILRLQRLAAAGVKGTCATVIAALAWENAHVA